MRTVSTAERRRLLVAQHHLDGGAAGPDDVVHDLVAVHATDPATPFLSVLARSRHSSLADVSSAMYEARSIVRWMAMRRTLFVFATAEIPNIQSAVSTPLADALRRQLVSRLDRNGSEPPVLGATDAWIADVTAATSSALDALGSATGAQLAARVADLNTVILARAASDRPQKVTSPLLTVMSAAGLIVRGSATGAWTSRNHAWEPVARWWADGMPLVDEVAAQRSLAQRYVERYGPVTPDDFQWWTGWSKTMTTRAIGAARFEEVEVDGRPALMAAESGRTLDASGEAPPSVALLPSLDSTPMGYKTRDWFLSIEPHDIFDSAGNIGPTVWWNGEIIGSWAVAASGEVRSRITVDRGREAGDAVEAESDRLRARLNGAVVTPSIRTALERSLA